MANELPSMELTSSSSLAEPVAGDVIAGRYKLLEPIGEGGMGEVWIAEQTEPVRRRVALKLIKAGMDSRTVLARFDAERQALAVMDHPNIAKVLDGGRTEQGRPFFVMEYVKGVPITQYCDDARLSVQERVALFVPVCQAVQHAHQKGIIHRDLKPSNILVCLHDGQSAPKVIDFGLAKAMHQPLTEQTLYTGHGVVMGTPLYMSPEQADAGNLDIDTRTDIYSLGVILYELLTGTTPLDKQRFRQASWDEVRRIIREEEPPTPSTRLSSLHPLASISISRRAEPAKLTRLVRGELDWIVMKCLEKERARRYETATGLALDLQRFLAGEPVQAAPPSKAYRLRKFVCKHRAGLATAAAIALLLVVGAAVSTWQAVRATKAEADARAAHQAAAELAEAERQTRKEAQAAADAEKKAREQAQKRLAQIMKGNEIITSIFIDLDLRKVKQGSEPLEAVLAGRLVKAAAQLEGEAVGDPLVVADLQDRLGRSLLSLGQSQAAMELFLKALATRTSHLGTDHPDTLTTMNNLATAYQVAGKLDLALPLYEETLKLTKTRLGADHPDSLASMNNLALAYRAAGKLDLALPLLEETLMLKKARLGPDHPDTLTTMNNLATAYQDAGKLDQALPLLEETLKLQKAKLGADHPDTLLSMNNLAEGYHAAGKLDLALPLLEETLKLQKATLGADHPDTLLSMNNLASAYHAAGKLDLALPLLEETLKLRKAKLGADHPSTLASMNNLAEGYRDAGKLDLALPLYEETLKLMKARLGADHPDTLLSMNNLALAYRAAGKLDLALPLLEETLKLRKARLGADHPDSLASMNNLAYAYHAVGKLDQALLLFEEVLKLRKAKLGTDHPDTLRSMNNLAMAYHAAGKLDLALPLLEETLKLRKARLGADHPDSLNSMNNLALGYYAAGKLDLALPLFEEAARGTEKRRFQHEHAPGIISNTISAFEEAKEFARAETWRRKWLAVVKERSGAESPAYAGELAALGLNLLIQKKWADAETVLRDCLDIQVKKQPNAWATFNTMSMLGAALLGRAGSASDRDEKAKLLAEAEPLLVKGHEGLKQRADMIPPADRNLRIREAIERLVQLYEALDKPDEAARWRKELDALKPSADK